MNALQNNYRWLKDNTPVVRYFRQGKDREVNTQIICGRTTFNRSKKSSTVRKNIYLGARNGFGKACRPAVTVGVVSKPSMDVYVSVSGLEKQNLPGPLGFSIKLTVDSNDDKWKIPSPVVVHWQVVGYGDFGKPKAVPAVEEWYR